MNRLLFSLAAVTAFGAALPLPAEAVPPKEMPPLELPVTAAMLKEPNRCAYGVYVSGAKAGWGTISQTPEKWEGKDCVTASMHMKMEMKALGNTMQLEMKHLEHYDAAEPHRALALEQVENMDGQERRVSLRLKEGTTYGVEITEAGKVRAGKDVSFDLRLTHKTSAEVWVADPLRKAGDVIGSVEFDFEKMELKAQTTTILAEAQWTGPGGKLPVWEIELYDFAHKLPVKARVSRTDGELVNLTMGGLIEMRLEPEAVAKQMPGEQADLFLAMTVKSDRKLGTAANLKELELELTPGKDGTLPELEETVNQAISRKEESGSVIIRLTRGGGKRQPATEEERVANLKATLRYPADQEEVKKLAARAAGDAKNEEQKVRNLLRFTDFYLRDSYEVEALSVMDLMKSRKGECSAHALLFTALARAAGIPAREAGGWLYMGDSYQAFGGHAWNEVILDGHWVPVDAIFQQMQLDAGHIQSHAGEVDGKAFAGFTSGLKAKVIASKRE